jgi:hypothetical protein
MPEHKKKLSTTNKTEHSQRPEPSDLSFVDSIDLDSEDQDAPPPAPRVVHHVFHFSNYNATEEAAPYFQTFLEH